MYCTRKVNDDYTWVGADGRRSSAGGSWKEGKVSTDTRSFGTFYIAVDTVPPRIAPAFKADADFGSRVFSEIMPDDVPRICAFSIL